MKSRPDASERTVSIVLFTDGLEDIRGLPNPISIPSNISLIPEDQPFIFFISLGEHEHEKQLEDFVKNPKMGDRGEVVRDPGANGIAEVGDKIRKKIEAPPPPKEANLSLNPTSLDFGQIEPGERTSRQALSIQSAANLRARLTLEDQANSGVTLAEPTEPIELKAGESVSVQVSLQSTPQMTDGARTVRLILTPEAAPNVTASPVYANASVNIVHVPIWRKILKWILLFLLLLALIIVAISVVKGEPPWVWVTEITGGLKPTLEGEIEVIQPRPARAEDEFISLTQRQVKSLRLSTILPDGASADSDAELTVGKKNGQKSIELRRTEGVVRVNKVDVNYTSIYDGDIIELGNARLRFNWVGHEKPVESDDNDLT